MVDRYEQAEWLEWSGLPAALNGVRANGWLVFKKIVELDCRAGRRPGVVEIPVADLAERCGLDPAAAVKILEALRKKKFLRCYLPDHPAEAALLEIRTPVQTPVAPEVVALRTPDPHLRDVANFRYTTAEEAPAADLAKVQEVVDLYLNRLSQKMNTFVLEQIEMVAQRFELEDIHRTVERAARHEIRSIGWVLKELIREQGKKKKKL